MPEQPIINPGEMHSNSEPVLIEQMADDAQPQPVENDIPPEQTLAETEGRQQAEEFINRNAQIIGLLVGVRGLDIKVGNGWATNLETGEVTVDPTFFIREGYRPEWAAYGTLHELVAHLREVITEPELTREVMAFSRRGDAYSIFHNILSDAAGNKDIHRRLPVMARTGAEAYAEKLFPGDDYRNYNPGNDPGGINSENYGKPIPRHLQFLYSIIRTEMIPGSQTAVSEEVAQALAELRNFSGTGQNAIKAATDPGRRPRERFELMTGLVLPVYLRLLEQDKQDDNFKPGSGQAADGEGQPQPTEGQPQPGEGQKPSSSRPDFSKDYKNIKDRHPEPISEADQRRIRRDSEKKKATDTPEGRAKRAMEQQTGHSMREIQQYRRELAAHSAEIEQMQAFFEQLISRRLATIRRLGRPTQDGIMLDPSLLAQTHSDVQSGISDPPTFLDYERQASTEQMVGGYDIFLVVDTSGSMSGDKAELAATSAIIFTEGLDLFEQRIKEVELLERVNLGLDINTQVMTYGNESKTLKPLSPTLSEKERLDAYAEIRAADGGGTEDYLALEEIADDYEARLGRDPALAARKKIIIVETDGESNDAARAQLAIDRLRELGYKVIGMGIEDSKPVSDAQELYAPDGRTIQDATQLPNALVNVLETQLS